MKLLVKRTPEGFIRTVNDELASLLNRGSFFPEYIYNDELEQQYAMPVELYEKENEYVLKAELPGIKKEDLDIDMDKKHITINAKKVEEKDEEMKGSKKSEFHYGEFARTVYFPMEIDTDKTSAKLEHGILRIIAPKMIREENCAKKLIIE